MLSPARLQGQVILANTHGLRPAATTERRLPAWLSARVVSDLVLVAYGIALGLLGVFIQATAAGADGASDRSYDPLIGCFVAALFVLLCILIANIDLRELQTFRPTLRKLAACFAAALAIFAVFAWSTQTPWREAQGAILLWFVLGCGLLAALHRAAARRLGASTAIRGSSARAISQSSVATSAPAPASSTCCGRSRTPTSA